MDALKYRIALVMAMKRPDTAEEKRAIIDRETVVVDKEEQEAWARSAENSGFFGIYERG